MNKTQMQRQIPRACVIEFPPPVQENDQGIGLEADVEARLHEVTNLAEGFSDPTFNLVLTQNASVRNAIEELLVKETALRWIIRVAKRSTGKARESLWADIDRVLTGLENTAAWVMHAEEERLIRI
jgi:hypothetical protein